MGFIVARRNKQAGDWLKSCVAAVVILLWEMSVRGGIAIQS